MQRILMGIALSMALTGAAMAQASSSGTHKGGDAAVTYQWVHTNAQPAQCGCFSLNGLGLSASLNVVSRVSAVAEVSGQFAKEGPPLSSTLTLASYLGGARVALPHFDLGKVRLAPFAQALVGTSHAGGGIAGAGDGTYSFAARIGGGLDVPVQKRIAARVQVDYFSTEFANGANKQQNNVLVAAGIVYRWTRSK